MDVEIDGLEGELENNVAAHLSIVTEGRRKREKDERPLSEADIRRLHRGAAGEIAAALEPYGYYAATVDATLTPQQGAAGDDGEVTWLARYLIEPGPVTRVRGVEIRLEGMGKERSELLQLIAEADIKPGDVLVHPVYSDLKSALQSEAYALGYLDGTFERSRIEVYPDRLVADVALVFDTGSQFYFGEVSVEQAILSPEFIDRFVEINAGEVFDPRRLTDLQLALSDSDYFNTAEMDIQRDLAEGVRVPVRVNTTPSRPRRYQASLGYGTDTGVRGELGVLWRHINRYGHQFRADIRLSQIQQTLVGQYKVPVGDVRSEYVDFTGDINERDLNDVDATRYSLGSSLNQNRWGGRRRYSLFYEYESWNFGDKPRQDSTLLVPGIEYDRIIGDDLLFTREGYSVSAMLAGAAENLLSDTSFLQGLLTARYVTALGERGRLLLRGDYGATAADDFDSLPPSRRFFTGGARSVRGYGFEELSPVDDEGNLVGGRYLGVVNVEVDYLVYGNFGVAAFVDSGNASNSADIDFKTGAGIGLRYKTPVGMVRVDFAHPFDDPDSSFAFHISFGPDLQ